jgi:hypothetical protein
MKKFILIILSITIIVSCSTKTANEKNNRANENIVLVSDTDLTFQTKKQKIRFVVNDSGEIEMLKIYGDTAPQIIRFNENGFVSQLTNKKGKEKENVLYFETNGQVNKIKTFDPTNTNGGDQFIWFANSDSKSLLIDYDKSHIPIVYGLKDTFEVNKENVLYFKTTDTNADNAIIELANIEYDTTALKINIPKNKLNCMYVVSSKQGTFKITGSVNTDFLKKKPVYGIINKLDFYVTFK